MKMNGAFTYLGIDEFKGKTGEVYKSACFLQGTEVTKVFLQPVQLYMLEGIAQGTAVTVQLDIRVGQKTFISLDAVNSVQAVTGAKEAKTA